MYKDNVEQEQEQKTHRNLATSKMSNEVNYNFNNGMLNNDYKPSIIERLKEYQQTVNKNNGIPNLLKDS